MIRTNLSWGAICGYAELSYFGMCYASAIEPWERKAAEGFVRRFALKGPIDVPEVDSPWWQIARNPDLGELTGILTKKEAEEQRGRRQEPVDFAIWQATDGTWQLVSCIRSTSYPGSTRLFYRWEGKRLTDPMWEPKGIFATSDLKVGHVEGRMQAPHCFRYGGKYYFFYNSTGAHCMISDDGKNFTHHKNIAGDYQFFKMGRDVMLFHDQDKWYAYYCGKRMEARTVPSLEGPWSKEAIDIGISSNPESPFVVRYGEGYYLWSQKWVFYSKDPLDFSVPILTDMQETWAKGYAPEILLHEGQYYFTGYARGIWVGKMKWVRRTPEEIKTWRIANYHKYRPKTPEEKAIQTAKVRLWSATKGKELREKLEREWKAKKEKHRTEQRRE